MKQSLNIIYRKYFDTIWNLCFLDNTLEEILSGQPIRYREVRHTYRDRWFADPFILEVTDSEIILLVEELRYADHLGRISQLVIDRKGMYVKDRKDVLVLPTHLSFPAITRREDKVYIYPENWSGGGLKLYEYEPKSCSCNEVQLLSDRLLTDAVYTELFGEELLFSTEENHNPNGDILNVYSRKAATALFAPFTSVRFPENTARNAGDFFTSKGLVYRPAQVCNNTYGEALSLQRVVRQGNHFSFEEVRRLSPPDNMKYMGMHTFNHYKGVVVIDFKIFLYPWIGYPIFKFLKMIRKNHGK